MIPYMGTIVGIHKGTYYYGVEDSLTVVTIRTSTGEVPLFTLY